MRKKIIILISLVLVVTSLFGSGTTAHAWGGGDADVELSKITVTSDDDFFEGSTVAISGNIIATAEAAALGLFSYTEASAEGGYSIYDPDGKLIYSNSKSDYDDDWGLLWSSSDAEVYLSWSVTFILDRVGEWEVSQWGDSGYNWYYWWFRSQTGCGSASDENGIKFKCLYDFRQEIQMGAPFGHDSTPIIGDREATAGDLFVVGEFDGDQYVIFIPAGTVVIDKTTGKRPFSIFVTDIVDGKPIMTPSVELSQPGVVYKVDGHLYRTQKGTWVGGTLIEIGTFTEG